jgi:hypothetical protein
VTRLQELEGTAANVAAEAPASGWLDEVPTFKQVRRKSIRVTFLQVGARNATLVCLSGAMYAHPALYDHVVMICYTWMNVYYPE